MSGKALDLFKTLAIVIISIIVIGAIVEDAFQIGDAAKKIFLGIGGLGAIILVYRTFLKRMRF
jgi:hypothetical protein